MSRTEVRAEVLPIPLGSMHCPASVSAHENAAVLVHSDIREKSLLQTGQELDVSGDVTCAPGCMGVVLPMDGCMGVALPCMGVRVAYALGVAGTSLPDGPALDAVPI